MEWKTDKMLKGKYDQNELYAYMKLSINNRK